MNEDVRRSRLEVTRRRALSMGAVGLAGVLAACSNDGEDARTPANTPTGTSTTPTGSSPAATTATTATATAAPDTGAEALLATASRCTLAKEETQGPYWFDVDTIRRDVREDRPGTRLDLAIRVLEASSCADGTGLAGAVVEIWHCDAGGEYSGFEGNGGGPPGGGPGGGGGATSDGSYSSGDQQATPSDDGTYLRGAQVTDARGIVHFVTVFPGWYRGRTTHIHVKMHRNRKTVRTTQLYFDEKVNSAVYATAPYDDHTGRETFNDDDSIFDAAGLVSTKKGSGGYLAAINLVL